MNNDLTSNRYQSGQNPNAQPFDPTAAYYENVTPTDVQASSVWYEVSCVRAGAPNLETQDAIRALSFDPRKELIWVGTASGMLHAHHANDMSRVVSTYVSEPSVDLSSTSDVRDIVSSQESILAAVGYGLAIVGRGGALKASVHADTVKNAKALALNPLTDRHVCIGGDSRMLAVIDVEEARIVRQATLRGATGVTAACWAATQSTPNYAIFSTATGRISFCDPSSMREVNAVAAFAGATTAIATTGYYLAATGLASRGGMSYLEQHVKVFDIRSIETPLPSVMFPALPMFVSFDPYSAAACNSEAAIWVLAPNGLMQLLDISSVASGEGAYPLSEQIQLDAGSDMLTSMAVSSQGLLVMGDSGGFVHQWASTDSFKVNENSEPIWNVPVPAHPPAPSIRLDVLMTSDFGASIPKCAIPDFDNGFLTDRMFETMNEYPKQRGNVPLHSMRTVADPEAYASIYHRQPFARFPLVVSDEIANRAQMSQSNVAYAQAPPAFVRNSESGHKKAPYVRGLMGSDHASWRSKSSDRNASGDPSSGTRRRTTKLDLSKPAAKSSFVEMDLVAWESIEGFNFLQYNQSGLFCGLENALPNVYVNAVVQVLYFSPPIRKAVGNHVCDRDWCISCELGFLFHMFDLGGAGMACEAGNFTRAFMTMANAGALGLLDGAHALPLSQRIENFSRYLLEQLHKDDEAKVESTVSEILGGDTVSYGAFMNSGTKWERKSRPFQHTLVYDGGKGKEKADSFCDLLETSLWQSLTPTRAFCEASQQFETMTQRRELRSLPDELLLGCNTKARGYQEWWLGDEGGISETEAANVSLDEIAARAMERKKKLVQAMRVDVSDGISVREIEGEGDMFGYDERADSTDGAPDGVADSGAQCADYDLSFVIVHVAESAKADADSNDSNASSGRNVGGHIVAYIRVPEAYYTKGNAGSSKVGGKGGRGQWWCFNDFVISKCESFKEVSGFDPLWKMPCMIGFVRRDVRERVAEKWWQGCQNEVNVREVLGDEGRNAAVGLLEEEEAPRKGSVLALDCEFVMVSRDEADIFADGTRQVVIPARMALARVSVVRGHGDLQGKALIDDYVAVREPVVDYLTRFSGLSEGDLQVGRSAYTVSSLKSVYKRLRCLVDAGCLFVGHGLKSDFRIINFVVPPEQVIDTVTIFRMGNRRLLGLRFLSRALLGDDIQSETHDSIEDANAALRLYLLYVRLKGGDGGSDRFDRILKDLYTYGYGHNWKVDEDDCFVYD